MREEVVRLRGEGWSLRRIAAHMNEVGQPTPAGRACWTQNTVFDLLTTRHVREMSVGLVGGVVDQAG
ncbi:recombinase family protein [Kribbella koreensis]|uniref:recombinase family protein n=1 Tax=Kribbella koreensis TaxID=57909 RepID=UPI003CD0BF04